MNKTELRSAFKNGLAKVSEKEFDKIVRPELMINPK